MESTVVGLIALLVPVLVVVGWIAPDAEAGISTQLGVIVEALFALIGGIGGLWAVLKLNDSTG